MRFFSPGMALVVTLCLAAAPTNAQGPSRYIVVLPESTFPERLPLLRELRKAIRTADGPAFSASLSALVAAHAERTKELDALVASLGGTIEHRNWAIGGANVLLTPSAAATLAAHQNVDAVLPDSVLASSVWRQTDANNHNSDAVNANGVDGSGVTVAIVDSGIDIDSGGGSPHPAFDDANGNTRIVKAVSFGEPKADDQSAQSHGTGVAGVVAGRDWGLPFAGSDDGLAPGANIASYRITFDTADNYFSADWIEAWHEVLRDRLTWNVVAAVASYKGSPSPTHPTQRILDVVGHYGDVLVASSAGNLGLQEISSSSSQSNANGIAVGAVHADVHDLATFSSSGPLPGDASRYWPDLCAMGVQVYAPRKDLVTGPGLPRDGTSFAAPCVTGTAALLRSADPTLSALDAKAWILNSTEDVSSSNPLRVRYDFGLGLLRTDLAVDQMQNGARFAGEVAASGSSTTVTVPVQAGLRYAATLAWARTDDSTTEWNDLDLRVLDPNGIVVAVSETPRNLYERVVFAPQSTGTYQLEVRTIQSTTPDDRWTLVFAENAVAALQPGRYESYGVGCTGTGVDPGAGIIAPAALAQSFGNHRTAAPFAAQPTKTHHAIDGATIPFGTQIEAIAFRADDGQIASAGFDCNLEVKLGHTTFAPNDLSVVFADNPAGPMTTVFQGTHHFAATSSLPTGPDDFAFVIPLTTPFVTATSSSQHLLVELVVTSHSMGSQRFGLYFDAELDVLSHFRILASDPLGQFPASGTLDGVVPAMSLLTTAAGSIAPRLDAQGPFGPGDTFEVALRFAPTNAAGILVHGDDATIWGGLPLPFDLGIIGAPGCSVLTNTLGAIGVATDAGGSGFVDFAIANDPTLAGRVLLQQFLVFDPAANPLGLTVSPGGELRIGQD
ncbi:MAG: S8 family serine peptidase [Planctomycetes bacterium]|nr:S8 family serine peptidase [Planctomycetota bacterium]